MRGRNRLVPKVLELDESDICDIEPLEESKNERRLPLTSVAVHPSRPFINPEAFDVDQMTYEQLLELEALIGNVSKGLSKEQIAVCL